MSDNINEANNICVPEDAFEKFQADNVCEEDDFITLADIMPSQPPTQDVIVDLDEIQDDISIVDEPEQQIHDGNITKLSSSNTNPDHEIHSDTTSTVDDVQFVPNEPLQPTSVTPSAENEEKDEINRNISLCQTNSDEHCFSCVSDKVSVDQTPSSMVTSLRAPKRAQKRRSSLEFSFDGESNESLVFNESSQSRKRGRPKRTDTINCQLQSSLDMNDALKKKTGRHRKQKNSSHNESEDSQIVTNFSNSEKVCDTSSTDDKSLNQTVEESVKPTTQSAKEINSSESLAVSSEEKELNNSLESASNSVIVTSSKKPRRPRQKKSFYTYEPIYPSEDQNSSQKPEGHAHESSSQVKDTPAEVTKPAAKRGRAKSMANNDQRINHFDHDYVHSSNQSTEGDLGKKKGKRGRQTKSNCELTTSSKSDGTNDAKDQEAVEKIYDEVELELIRILSTPTNDLEENIEKKQAKNNQNPPKRRGRKPKKQPSVDNNTEQSQDKKEILPDDDADDICLSSLKKQLKPSEDCPIDEKNVIGEEANEVILKDNDINKTEKVDDTPLNNQNLSRPSSIVTDQNTDNINNLATIVDENVTNDNESESSSKRPVRRKAKKILHYDEGSDEDPFANVELSDDDLSGRKAGRYYSDDEYIPGKRKKGKSFVRTSSSEEESEDLDKEDELIFKKQERKKRGKKTDESSKKSPHKNRRQSNVNHDAVPDITSTAADTTTQIDEQVPQSPDAFDNIIVKKILGGNIQIKKVSAATPIQSTLEIPVLDPNEPKKIVEVFTQTTKAKTKSVEVQTTAPYEGTMKNKVPLTLQQSEKACQFLQGIVKTTSDLGQLMIQKSEDFIQKKINTENITDTTKLDYCVKKSFLLFKLARHNLVQMEEDLANEYEQFLQSNNMSQYRDVPKSMSATPKQSNSDSDCEIIEEPVMQKEKEKPKFNLKTVFLNKELSIKMAKPQKSFEQPLTKKNLTEKVNVQGRHTVWINDSIMVKKVKPTHSFLAQDSRNKKPPDSCITVEAVKQFFDNYYKKRQVLKTCAPFISPEWMNVRQTGVCYYFIDQINDLSTHSPVLLSAQAEAESSGNASNNKLIINFQSQPLKLKTLCFKVLQKCMFATRIHDYLNVDDKYNSYDKTHYQPATLFGLSFNVISKLLTEDNKAHQKVSKNISITRDISSLQIMSLNRINNLFFNPLCTNVDKNVPQKIITVKEIHKHKSAGMNSLLSPKQPLKRNFKTLFSHCFDMLQKTELCLRKVNNYDIKENNIIFTAIKPLKCIAYEAIKLNLYNDTDEDKIVDIILEQPELSFPAVQSVDETDDTVTLTIESVNTLSDDIFSNIPETAVDVEPPILENDDSNFSNYDEFEHEYEESNDDNNLPEESNWVSKVQLQELKSCFLSVDDNVSKPQVSADDSNKEYAIAQIKIEPMEEITENEVTAVIKREPVESVDDIVNFTPLITKLENTENLEENEAIPDKNNHSYDEDAFESFARTSKMLHAATDYSLSNEEIFSQSALRVRRQHEPDFDDDIDTSMSLLVPQDNIEQAKDRLMESSSDDENVGQKNAAKKKRRGRPKGTKGKVKDVVSNKDKQTVNNEVALLTKKMQDKIRQEEKKDESSDSELENSLALRRENSKKTVDKTKSKTSNQIQCNDVDSTENLNDSTKNNLNKEENKKKPARTSLRNKSKEDQLEESNESKDQGESFVMQADEPVELLECEPTLPMMHDDVETVDKECPIDQETVPAQIKEPEPEEPEQTYIDRHGWKCFPVNTDDTKLYENTYILLEKLPESFVETYFRYQGMTDKDQDDTDVERLTNLQSLHRNVSRENKWKSKSRTANGHLKKKETDSSSRPSSPANNEDCDEFSPSEDEEANIDDETAPPAPHQDAVENAMAKDWLMNDGERDSDSEKPSKNVEKTSEDGEKVKIKKEVTDEPSDKPRRRPGPKSRCKEIKEIDSLMLTADKMMNKELALLHAPVSLNVENQDVKDVQKKPSTKNKSTSKQKEHLERTKNEEDSSSEEEKQWVNTKEKLLKRLEKKQGNPSVDDAKRAKIVSEFIERRGEAPEKRPRGRGRSRRSGKKFLERQKQMSVLNKELFGEVDTTLTGRKHSNALGKGRKNIRKVIDKKSLARSTVIANMEEFERKRRLNMQQTRLREELGCEEGVNVLVINDEVCLEYDFEEMRPVVTVHPFFTRVMKAHQYEGVKFMWDACFESIAMVESGHPGGGCILAHCMGLGKTLQVLALLHTVLTHPRVRMHRILVCCPLSTVLNWVDEIHKWIGPVTNQIKVFELSKLKKTYERAYQLEDWYNGGGIFIIGYELFRSLTTLDAVLDDIRPTIVNKIRMALLDPGPDVVICDEGHLLKNDSSVLAVAMSRVATKRRIVLTGTPMQNNLREYYCMVNFVKPSLLGTYSEYSNRFENPIMNGQHRDSQEEDIKLMKARTHILHKVLEGCLQRQEASVLYPYLPKKHEYTVFIPPTKCQWDLYKHYIMTYAINQQQNNVEKQKKQHSVLKDFHVLQKIWTHPQVLHNFLMKGRDERNKIKMEKLEDDLAQEDLAASEDVKPNQTEVWWLQYLEGGGMLDSLESSNKFMVVFQLLEECIALGDKVLIFSTSLYTMDALEYFLKHINKWSLGQEYYRLDGSVPAEVRQKWCREFNAEHNLNTKLFLISTRAGSLGLNMTAANRVIILDTSWNPAHDIQSIFRVYRFGQKKDCYIYRLVAMGTMEQKIYERSVTKQAVACRVVDEQQIDRHYNMSELTELYRFDEEGTSVEAGLAAGVADVALLRVAARARLHAVREHDSLLRGSREQHLPEHERAAAWMQFQQEHANEEMQDRLMEASRGIQHMLAPQLAMQSGLMPIKTENGMQLQVPIPVPPPPPSQGKKKRGRKPANSIPPSPENIVQMAQAVTEDAKVKMIMKLLIKHNFLDTKPASEVSQLVSNVRRIVDNKGVGLEDCDELTRSIATVMLEEEEPKQPTTPPPALTDIITGDLDSTPHQPEIKQEVPEVENQFEVPNETSLLVPVREEVRRQRGRPRKYSVQDKPKPLVPRGRGRPRKRMVSDSEDDSKGVQSSSSSSSGITSRRTRNSPRNSYVSDVEEVLSRPESCYTSKESSPILFDERIDNPEVPIEKPIEKAKEKPTTRPRPKRQISSYSEQSDVSLIDDDSNPPPSKDQSVVLDDSGNSDSEGRNSRSRKGKIAPPVEVAPEPVSTSTGKTKRKAALAAKQHLESLNSDDIVTLDDDDDEWVADSVDLSSSKPASETSKDKSETARADTKYKKSYEKRIENSKTEKNKGNPPKEPPKNQNYLSILLSDDEDFQAVETDPKPSPQAQDISTSETKEEISLHPSMLSNVNFIKIVAYAYQSNRMLDEDAALLAAQYSTQKALKEIETTGKSITSGPLYDIAVKVLGTDVLKKLHDKKDKGKVKKTSEVDAPSLSISVKQNEIRNEPVKNKTERPKITIKSENLIKPLNFNEKQKKSGTASNITSNKNANCGPAMHVLKNKEKRKSPNPEVVPVGMFKGILPMNQKSDEVEECILPDDDDVIFHRSTNANPPVSQPPPTSIYKKPNAQPFVITSVSSSKRPEPIPMPTPPRADITTPEVQQSNIAPQQPVYLTISNGKLVIPASVTKEVTPNVVPGAAPVQQPPANDTICLDSDEEEVTDVPPPPPPPPLQSIPLGPLPAKPPVSNQTFQPVPLAPVHQSPLQPSPVALSTSVPGANPQIIQMPVLTDVQGMPVMFRLDDAPSIVPNIDQTQQQGFIIIDPATGNLMTPDVPNPPNPPMLPTPAIPMPAPAPKVAQVTEKKDVGPGTKKVCKPGDIVRITKEGSLEVLSRVDRLPNNVKAQSISSKVENRPEPKLQPPVPEKRKTTVITPVLKTRPNATFTSKDPLSILKDVVQIRAFDEPIAKTSSKIEAKPAPKQTKYVAIAPKYDSKVANKSNDNMSRVKPGDNSNLNKYKATVVQYKNDKNSSNNSSMQGNKKVISASPKDIIIRTKPSGSSLVKASASTSNVRPANVKTYTTQYKDLKKRASPWPDTSSVKKKKVNGVSPAPPRVAAAQYRLRASVPQTYGPMTLKDFNIDDIDDIIELE